MSLLVLLWHWCIVVGVRVMDRSRKSVVCNPLVQAVREAWQAEGMSERCQQAGAWLRGVWGGVKRRVAAVVREFSPVLPCSMADAVPVLPVVESVTVPTYAPMSSTITAECQRWVSPLDVARVVSAVQRVEAERVTADAEVLYVRKGSRYVAVRENDPNNLPRFRRTTVGKATRYHAL